MFLVHLGSNLALTHKIDTYKCNIHCTEIHTLVHLHTVKTQMTCADPESLSEGAQLFLLVNKGREDPKYH